MPEIDPVEFKIERFISETPATGVLAAIDGAGVAQNLIAWDPVTGDTSYFAPAGTGSNTRIHRFDRPISSTSSATFAGVTSSAAITVATTVGLYWDTRSRIKSSADGVIDLFNIAETGFTRLNLGGTTSGFPGIARSGSDIEFRLADNSGRTGIIAHGITAHNGITVTSGTSSFQAITATTFTGSGQVLVNTGATSGVALFRANTPYIALQTGTPTTKLLIGDGSAVSGTPGYQEIWTGAEGFKLWVNNGTLAMTVTTAAVVTFAASDVRAAGITGTSNYTFSTTYNGGGYGWYQNGVGSRGGMFMDGSLDVSLNVNGTIIWKAFATGGFALGTNPATSGILRLPNAQYVYARNAANTADILIFGLDSANRTNIEGPVVVIPSVGTTASGANAFLDSGNFNSVLRSTSSLRYKDVVGPMLPTDAIPFLMGLDPFWYHSLASADDRADIWPGFSAERVAQLDDAYAYYDAKGRADGVMYDRITIPLVVGFQDHEQRIANHDERIGKLEESVKRLAA